MIRLLVLLIVLVGIALIVGVVFYSRHIDRQQEARRKENQYDGTPCVVCGVRVYAEDSNLCLDHTKAMREVDRDTWVPIDDLRATLEGEA